MKIHENSKFMKKLKTAKIKNHENVKLLKNENAENQTYVKNMETFGRKEDSIPAACNLHYQMEHSNGLLLFEKREKI